MPQITLSRNETYSSSPGRLQFFGNIYDFSRSTSNAMNCIVPVRWLAPLGTQSHLTIPPPRPKNLRKAPPTPPRARQRNKTGAFLSVPPTTAPRKGQSQTATYPLPLHTCSISGILDLPIQPPHPPPPQLSSSTHSAHVPHSSPPCTPTHAAPRAMV
jgi:hypothetical protein